MENYVFVKGIGITVQLCGEVDKVMASASIHENQSGTFLLVKSDKPGGRGRGLLLKY